MSKVFLWVLKKVFGLKLAFIFLLCPSAKAQNSDSLRSRKQLVSYGVAGTYGLSLIGLNQLWYQDYERSSFQFFNDNQEWLQVDKVGHAYSTYILSESSAALYRWAGYNRKQAALYASGGSFAYLASIELMDAYSAEWGFSWGDLAANAFGNGLFLAQEVSWEEQRIRIKFSYSPTQFREQRPEILGSTELQGVFKDYNGQTYWASINLASFHDRIKPSWLNLAIGMGGTQMISAEEGTFMGLQNQHQRQWYVSPDIDFSKLKSKKKWVRTAFVLLNSIKLPAPAIEVGPSQSPEFHWLFF